MATVTSFTANALRSACDYVSHSKRTLVTKDDTKKALKAECFLFLERTNQLHETKKYQEMVLKDDIDENENKKLIVDDSNVEEYKTNNETQKVTCSCKTCDYICTIEKRWN